MARPYEGGKSPSFSISKKWLSLYQAVCPAGAARGGGYRLFDKYTNLYTLCAALGHSLGRQDELSNPYPPFTLEQVGEEDEWPTLLAIAWDHSNNNPDVFVRSKDVIDICNRYAEGGMQYLHENFFCDHMEGEHLLSPEKKDLEAELSMIIKEVVEQDSML